MAKKRNVKKDIEYLTYEVLNDCFLAIDTNPEKHKDEILKIIGDAVTKRNELIKKVNDRKVEKKQIKKHFNAIYDDIMKSTDANFSRLSSLIKA